MWHSALPIADCGPTTGSQHAVQARPRCSMYHTDGPKCKTPGPTAWSTGDGAALGYPHLRHRCFCWRGALAREVMQLPPPEKTMNIRTGLRTLHNSNTKENIAVTVKNVINFKIQIS